MQPSADDLSDLERRLAACRPAATGLDADAMLFAAGQAAARRGGSSVVWPALAGGFAILSLTLWAGLMNERSERRELAERFGRMPTTVVETPPPIVAPSPPAPDSYLAIRQLMDQDGDAWLARSDNLSGPGPDSFEAMPILHVWPVGSAILQP
jgi:hypothetical protein